MIKSITATNSRGESLVISLTNPATSGFAIKELDGLGPAEADILITDYACMDGGSFNWARRPKRNITLTLYYWPRENETIEQVRNRGYKIFRVKDKVNLKIETDSRTVQSDLYVESHEPHIFEKLAYVDISLVAPDPSLYAIDWDVTSFNEDVKRFSFAFSNTVGQKQLIFGDVSTGATQIVNNQGDNEIGGQFTIYAGGSVSGITLINVQTNQTMTISATFQAGDYIVLDTRPKHKSCLLYRGSTVYDCLSCLGQWVDWMTFEQGENVVAFSATSGAASTSVRCNLLPSYEGI